MANVSKALIGKPVYRNGSFAPNRGVVNPTGYVQRELKKQGVSQIGADGQSDTRSTLAQQALSRQLTNTRIVNPTGSQSNPSQPFTTKTPQLSSTASAPAAAGSTTPNRTPVIRSTAVNSATGQQTPSTLQIHSNGQLDLPFDFQTAYDALQAEQAANDDLLDIQQDQQQLGLQYQRDTRDAGLSYGEQKRYTLNDNAARGTAFSSGYGVQVAENARDYNNMLSDLNTNYSSNVGALATRRAQTQANLQRTLALLALQQSVRQDAQAGQLGLNQ